MVDDPHNHMGDAYGRDDPSGCLSGFLSMIAITLVGIGVVVLVQWIVPILTARY